jgi:hypothetical protein
MSVEQMSLDHVFERQKVNLPSLKILNNFAELHKRSGLTIYYLKKKRKKSLILNFYYQLSPYNKSEDFRLLNVKSKIKTVVLSR